MSGGRDVPGTVVPGTAGVVGGDGGVGGLCGVVDGAVGGLPAAPVTGGVVAAPGPVPGRHGGRRPPGAAGVPEFAMAGGDAPGVDGATGDGGGDVTGEVGAGGGTGGAMPPGVCGAFGAEGAGLDGVPALPTAGVVAPPVTGSVGVAAGVFGVAAEVVGLVVNGTYGDAGVFVVVAGMHGRGAGVGGTGGWSTPGTFAGRPVGVGCAVTGDGCCAGAGV